MCLTFVYKYDNLQVDGKRGYLNPSVRGSGNLLVRWKWRLLWIKIAGLCWQLEYASCLAYSFLVSVLLVNQGSTQGVRKLVRSASVSRSSITRTTSADGFTTHLIDSSIDVAWIMS